MINYIIKNIFTTVPTSMKAQYLGFKSLQNPSKNHIWEDSFLAFKCLFKKRQVNLALS